MESIISDCALLLEKGTWTLYAIAKTLGDLTWNWDFAASKSWNLDFNRLVAWDWPYLLRDN